MQYDLPPWSISILPDCRTAVYNTARISSETSQMKMTPVDGGLSWESYTEETPSADDSDTLSTSGLWEQINITRDSTDYLWYMTDVSIASDQGFLKNEKEPLLTVMSAGHALHVFINGQLSGFVHGGLDNPKLTYSANVKLRAGINKISMLSVAVGLPVGLKGELLSLNTFSGSSSVKWVKDLLLTKKHPMTWYKATFDAPEGIDPLALDMGSMGKGQLWINGEGVGRHWPGYIARGDCGECNYAGLYSETKCQTNCEQPSQRWYHVPRAWLKPIGNLLVVFEEWGGDPAGILLARRSTTRVCADIVEGQPSLKSWHVPPSGKSNSLQPKAHLCCSAELKISDIQFATYGLPQGTCGNYHEGSCHAHKSNGAFEKNCIGQQSCSVNVVPEVFGGDPCPNTSKKLAVEAICS